MAGNIKIQVQQGDFQLDHEYQALTASDSKSGAVVTFVGLVRDHNQGQQVQGLHLEHYPGMTEKALLNIAKRAQQRWTLSRITIIHRVGRLALSEQIVFVGVTSKHREDAFEAAQFIMDYLKNQAPFWKKEVTSDGERWVSFNDKDKAALKRWE